MKNVYIWHGDGWGGDKLNWMYAPARKTLVEGFKNYNVNIDTRVKCYDWKLVKPESIFIWVGEYHAGRVPWKQFKQKNIYTIYYQSEPWNEGKKWNFDAREIWDYSMRNVVEIKKRVKNSKVVRYVPAGYLDSNKFILSEKNKLVFFGDKRWRPQYPAIKNKLKDKLVNIFNIWNIKQFNDFIKKDGVGIFLNLHKHNKCICVESLRMSQLLSAGGLVISERSSQLDENMYKDIVIFTNDFEKEYNKLMGLTLEDRMCLADKNLEKYKKEFSPRLIFERAKVNEII